jgi:hypothetical protein
MFDFGQTSMLDSLLLRELYNTSLALKGSLLFIRMELGQVHSSKSDGSFARRRHDGGEDLLAHEETSFSSWDSVQTGEEGLDIACLN